MTCHLLCQVISVLSFMSSLFVRSIGRKMRMIDGFVVLFVLSVLLMTLCLTYSLCHFFFLKR